MGIASVYGWSRGEPPRFPQRLDWQHTSDCRRRTVPTSECPAGLPMPTAMRTMRRWLHAKWRDLVLFAFRDPKNPNANPFEAFPARCGLLRERYRQQSG